MRVGTGQGMTNDPDTAPTPDPKRNDPAPTPPDPQSDPESDPASDPESRAVIADRAG